MYLNVKATIRRAEDRARRKAEQERAGKSAAFHRLMHPDLDPGLLDEVRKLLAVGEKIKAVRLLRANDATLTLEQAVAKIHRIAGNGAAV